MVDKILKTFPECEHYRRGEDSLPAEGDRFLRSAFSPSIFYEAQVLTRCAGTPQVQGQLRLNLFSLEVLLPPLPIPFPFPVSK